MQEIDICYVDDFIIVSAITHSRNYDVAMHQFRKAVSALPNVRKWAEDIIEMYHRLHCVGFNYGDEYISIEKIDKYKYRISAKVKGA